MDKKEMFKEFVKKNPTLINYVKNNEMTWQKFYEMYDLYGENNDIWNEYLEKKELIKNINSSLGITEIINWLKTINLDKMQESIGNIQRVLGVLEDLGANNKENTKKEYKPRPLYKHFED